MEKKPLEPFEILILFLFAQLVVAMELDSGRMTEKEATDLRRKISEKFIGDKIQEGKDPQEEDF